MVVEESEQEEWAVVDDLRQTVKKVDPYGKRTIYVRTRFASHLCKLSSPAQLEDFSTTEGGAPVFYVTLLSSKEREGAKSREQFVTKLLQAEQRDLGNLKKLGATSK